MTLKEAYNGWSKQPTNLRLYLSTRTAFVRSWLLLDMNKPCSEYTKETLKDALQRSSAIKSDKVNAASVMIHVLNYANSQEPKVNVRPDMSTVVLKDITIFSNAELIAEIKRRGWKGSLEIIEHVTL